ncbi:MAG: PQQ-dependent sugar dehydrogenase [Chitinophagaceae bacterium]|nr:PQQ-dependent sugar dehydrogenase [Chitinophagaceae bacterium]
MLRLNVDNFTTPPYYTIPADNPYVSDPAVRDEIFAIGFRNPWRWSFDRLNNDIWVGDVGEGAWEEINTGSLATFGNKNYGWRCYEGNEDHNTTGCLPAGNYTYPIFAYPHNSSTGGFAVTGGYVYRGTEYGAMYGYYICSDFISGNAWLIKPNGSGGWSVSQQSYVVSGGLPKFITSFGESENGVLYAVSYSGTLYKVTTNTGGPLPVTLLQFTAKAATGYNSLGWKTVNEQNLSGYEIEFSNNGVNYLSAGKVNAVNTPLENNYTFRHYITGFTKLFYKLKITGTDGRLSYSDIIVIDKTSPAHVKIYPTLVTNNRLNIVSEKPVEALVIFSSEGRKVFETRLNNSSGTINIPFPHLQKGVYIVQAKLGDEYFSEKIIIQQE